MEDEIAQGLAEVDDMPEEQMDQDEEVEEPQPGTTRQREMNESVDSQTRPIKKARFETTDENAGQKKRRGRPRKDQSDQRVLREGKTSTLS